MYYFVILFFLYDTLTLLYIGKTCLICITSKVYIYEV